MIRDKKTSATQPAGDDEYEQLIAEEADFNTREIIAEAAYFLAKKAAFHWVKTLRTGFRRRSMSSAGYAVRPSIIGTEASKIGARPRRRRCRIADDLLIWQGND